MNIIFRNTKEYLKINKSSWNEYLNIKSPYRNVDKSEPYNCGLKNKNKIWCNSCNTGIGSWNENCVNIINGLNLKKYENILKKRKNEDDFHIIEIDRNNNKSTI